MGRREVERGVIILYYQSMRVVDYEWRGLLSSSTFLSSRIWFVCEWMQ